MSEEISVEEYKKAYKEMMAEEEKRGFRIHLVAYVLVNAILIAVNFIYSPKAIWFFYPLLGWGIGITVHYLYAVRWIERDLKKKEAEAEYRARESIRK
ncbi:MAG: 2TM domain-containing protein [Methanosarcinales archaeon]|nr:2TM domain-containing protein [Methanosarcinales archaeon]